MPHLKWVAAVVSTLLIPALCQETVKYPDDYCEHIKEGEEFDFIVVGAGPSGSAVARRLAEEASIRVLLMEAGGDPTPESDVPQNALTLAFNYRWNFTQISSSNNCQGTLLNKCLYIPAAMLGGCSVVNFMMAVRGNQDDYDEWAALGNTGWAYKDVLPYFKKSENYLAQELGSVQTNTTVDQNFHNVGGPQDISYFPRDPKTADAKEAIIKAAEAVGIPFNSDVDGARQLGITKLPGTVNPQGIRQNSAKSYLLDIPDNLKICKNAIVNKVLINKDKAATGVEYFYPANGLIPLSSTKTVKAAKEVIVSGGPLNSPQILERSGIGSSSILKKAGVKPLHELPGVGENLQDQFINLGSCFELDYGNTNEVNPNSIDFTDLTAFVATDGGNVPDIQFILKDYTPLIGLGLGYNPIVQAEFAIGSKMIFGPIILRQNETGSVHITQSFSPRITPRIDTKQYASPVDIKLLVNATRLARTIMAQDALKGFKPKPFVLTQCKIHPPDSDEEIICMARVMGNTLYHIAGSTKMGPASDPMAVVDPNLKVHGIDKLRVIDSGIAPKVPRSNTQIPAGMIGEMGADIIKKAYGFIK